MFPWRQVWHCLRSTGNGLKAKVKVVSGCYFFAAVRFSLRDADELLTAVLALTVARFQADINQRVLPVV